MRKANQIELIDSPPEQLRRRMFHGNTYPKSKVPRPSSEVVLAAVHHQDESVSVGAAGV